MRMCIISQNTLKNDYPFTIKRALSFRSAEIYEVTVNTAKRKGKEKRYVRKCAKKLIELGVYRAAVSGDFAYANELSDNGMTVVTGDSFAKKHLQDLAVAFAETLPEEKEFLVTDGSCNDVVNAVKCLLEIRRCVYLNCLNFDEIAMITAEDTGACVSDKIPENAIELRMHEGVVVFEGRTIDVGSFEIEIKGLAEKMYGAAGAAVASTLEISGLLEKNDIKLRYLGK